MKKALVFIGGYVAANLALALFFAFVSWFESPATWRPESRFIVAFICTGAGLALGAISAGAVKSKPSCADRPEVKP